MPQIQDISAVSLNAKEFIKEKVTEISRIVGSGVAINALSGGVDSSVVTMLGHMALKAQLKTYFIDNGIMREGEPQQIASVFKKLGVRVEIIDAQNEFFGALQGVIDPEEKREAITQTFYKTVFGRLVKES
ncbi:MAG: asparagine synthase-related protein, partial [Planctomycetota bacterium]